MKLPAIIQEYRESKRDDKFSYLLGATLYLGSFAVGILFLFNLGRLLADICGGSRTVENITGSVAAGIFFLWGVRRFLRAEFPQP